LRMLVPLDGSQMSEAALEPAALLAIALASPRPAGLHLTLVVDLFDAVVRQSVPEALVIDSAKGYLIRATERLRATYPTLTITWSVGVDADVTTGILHVAERGEGAEGATPFGGCDLIVMATHGRSGFRRWALGSIAERVLHATKLPVMVVRPPQTQTAAPEPEEATSKANAATPVPTFAALF
ncbi:MAG TPA: universal stress protein, partial [Ktedonobacterales bacterium]|nr:universal stress protein [Ktedonobacterales bacterium]